MVDIAISTITHYHIYGLITNWITRANDSIKARFLNMDLYLRPLADAETQERICHQYAFGGLVKGCKEITSNLFDLFRELAKQQRKVRWLFNSNADAWQFVLNDCSLNKQPTDNEALDTALKDMVPKEQQKCWKAIGDGGTLTPDWDHLPADTKLDCVTALAKLNKEEMKSDDWFDIYLYDAPDHSARYEFGAWHHKFTSNAFLLTCDDAQNPDLWGAKKGKRLRVKSFKCDAGQAVRVTIRQNGDKRVPQKLKCQHVHLTAPVFLGAEAIPAEAKYCLRWRDRVPER